MRWKEFKNNTDASAVPIILFILSIISLGALYTLFFIEVAYPTFDSYVPNSDSKTFIMMCMYAIPLFLLGVGSVALIKTGLKREVY